MLRRVAFVTTLALGWSWGDRAGQGDSEPAVAPAAFEGVYALAGTPVSAKERPAQPAADPLPSEIAPLALAEENFFGAPDGPVRKALEAQPIATIEKGRGGRSLGFRVTFQGGQRAYYKPEQTFSAANWFSEVAAYHLDRMLGLGRVPAVVSRKLPWAPFAAAAGGDARLGEIIVRDGHVRGAMVAWVDGHLTRMEMQERWEPWLRLTHLRTSAVTPFQRPSIWAKQTRTMKKMGRAWRSVEERSRLRRLHPEPVRAERPAELSDLIVFDYLTRNLDRWGGRNGNVLIHGEGGPLVFLDNGAGFAPGDPRPELAEARIDLVERFRRSTILAVRAFDPAEYEARLAAESLAPILTRSQLDGLYARREALLARVAHLEAAHGEAIWMWD